MENNDVKYIKVIHSMTGTTEKPEIPTDMWGSVAKDARRITQAAKPDANPLEELCKVDISNMLP